MNIFALDSNPKLAAQYHVDRHVIKMILESCQLLSTAHRMLDGEEKIILTQKGRKKKVWVHPTQDSFLYSATHINHPSAIWCRQNVAQYIWLAQLTKELCKEYTYRYGKIHKCEQIGLVDWFVNNIPENIKLVHPISFVLPTPAMPDYCKVPGDVVQSYRNYYINEKQRMHSWKGKIAGRPVPEWIKEEELCLT